MSYNKLIETLPEEIDQRDKTFCLSYPVSPHPLVSFIKESCFISPLVLRKRKESKRYQIVSGFKRMAALKGIKGKVPAFVFSEKELSVKKAILLNFYENLSQRHFNDVEKAMVIEKLCSLGKISDEKLINYFLPLIGLPRNKKYLDSYLSLNQLEELIKNTLANGDIGVEAGIILAGLRPLVRQLFFSLIKRLRLNQNKTKEVISLFREISRRERKSIDSLLQEKEIRNSRDFSALRDNLLKRRFPEFKIYEKKFLNLVKGLKLPPKMKIMPPLFFESDRLKINIDIKEEKELEEILSALNRAFQEKKFGKLFSML